VTSAEWSRLRLTGDFRYNERDNKSSRDSYDYVLADNIDGGVSVENLPYGFKDTDFDLAADYRIARRVKGSVGYDYDKIERNLQEVNENEEDTFWAKLRIKPSNAIDIDIKGQTASRDGSTYRQVGGLKLEQNPLLRKYNMADRDRDGAEVRLQARPSERFSFGIQLDTWTEDYKNSEVGLTDADRDAISADASYAFSDDMHLFAGLSSEQATFKQRGAQSNVDPNTAPPNWRAKNKDDFDSATVGFRWDNIAQRWGLELDYTYAESQGSTSMGELAAGSGFPDFRSERNTARLDVTYELSPRMQLRGGWLYERYRSSDWHVDGTAPDTLGGVLTWGAAAADYEVSVVGVSFVYRLDLPRPPLEY
jgi:MtrB/PioB family decaheme-associated outer membrane protein